jgi:hypothetical protein
MRYVLAVATIATIALSADKGLAQQPYSPNGAPNLYKFTYG